MDSSEELAALARNLGIERKQTISKALSCQSRFVGLGPNVNLLTHLQLQAQC